jgi:hypothetical protein
MNVRTVAAVLRDIPPDGTIEGGYAGWRLLTALKALDCRVPIRGHALNRPNGSRNGHSPGDAYTASRTDLARERARLLRLQRREVEGELAPIAELADALRSIVLMIRAAALALPTKMAPRMIMLRTTSEAKAILDGEIRDWLIDLANTKIRVSKKKRISSGWENWVDDTEPAQ